MYMAHVGGEDILSYICPPLSQVSLDRLSYYKYNSENDLWGGMFYVP